MHCCKPRSSMWIPHASTSRTSHGLYLQAGGANIDVLRENMAPRHAKRWPASKAIWPSTKRWCDNLGLGKNASANDLACHQAQAHAAMEQIDARRPNCKPRPRHAIAQAHNAHTSLR